MALDDSADASAVWPLQPGSYRACLFKDDAYVPLACAAFGVAP